MKLLPRYFSNLSVFTEQNPAFLYAIAAILGCFSQLGTNISYLIPALFLLLPLFEYPPRVNMTLKIRIVISLFIFMIFSFYVSCIYNIPEVETACLGDATITIHSIRQQKTYFGRVWKCQGTLLDFTDHQSRTMIGKNLPFNMNIPVKKTMQCPSMDKTYRIIAKLHPRKGGDYLLTTDFNEPWHLVKKSSSVISIGEWRHQVKKKVTDYIYSKYRQKNAADFICGIAVGEFDSPELRLALSRFGLQHIMAISGFHFAIIAGIIHFALKLILPRRYSIPTLIFLLSGYYVFLGCGPSIIRAWLTITLALLAQAMRREAEGINSLGVAVLIILFYDPFMCLRLGFQFSTLTTAGILFFYQPIDSFLARYFKKRSLSNLLKMPSMEQHAYVLLSFFRQGISLSCAVNTVALPLMLFVFGKYPYLSLVYNLFFPVLVSLCMLFLILGSMVDMIIPGGSIIHLMNSYYTQFILSLASDLPTALDVTLRVSDIPLEALIGYLSALFSIGVMLIHDEKNRGNQLLPA